MTIRKPLGDLPPHPGSPQEAGGWAPDAEVRFAHLLAAKWHDENMATPERPHAVDGTRFRHSDAGGCSRKIAYKAAGLPATDPMDVTGSWNTRLGTMIHDAWQEALVEAYPRAQIEVSSQVFPDGSGSMDALVHTDVMKEGWGMPRPWTVSVELKTQGGTPFKYAIGKARRGQDPDGPKHDHVIQASLNALAHDADEVVIAYLAKETLSQNYDDVPDIAKFCAEWTLPRERYEPIARLEIERIEGILRLLDEEGKLAARKAPGFSGEIEDPSTSRAVKRNELGDITDVSMVWGGSYCAGYCDRYSGCKLTEPGRVDVEIARKVWPT